MPRTETPEEHAERQARTRQHRSASADISRRERDARVKHGGGLLATRVTKSGGRTKRSEIRERTAEVIEALEVTNLSPRTVTRLASF